MRKTFPRSFDALEDIFSFTREFFETQGIDELHRFSVDFALEEIFTNCVKYNRGTSQEIRIELRKDDTELRIALTDFDVEPFDITKSPDVPEDLPLEQRKVGGLGLHLTRKMMDSIDYEYANRESRITLVKQLG